MVAPIPTLAAVITQSCPILRPIVLAPSSYNVVRRLNNKVRRNCNNIGVAQIVAAKWSEDLTTGDVAAGALKSNGSVQLADSKYSFLGSDGSIAVHAGQRLGRGIVTDAITTPVVNTSAFFRAFPMARWGGRIHLHRAATSSKLDQSSSHMAKSCAMSPHMGGGTMGESTSMSIDGFDGKTFVMPCHVFFGKNIRTALVMPFDLAYVEVDFNSTIGNALKKTVELIDFKEKRHASFEYGCYRNPTTVVAEEKYGLYDRFP